MISTFTDCDLPVWKTFHWNHRRSGSSLGSPIKRASAFLHATQKFPVEHLPEICLDLPGFSSRESSGGCFSPLQRHSFKAFGMLIQIWSSDSEQIGFSKNQISQFDQTKSETSYKTIALRSEAWKLDSVNMQNYLFLPETLNWREIEKRT